MSTLNQDLLRSICLKLLKDEELKVECLLKFVLSGREPLEAFESLISSAKSVNINGNTFCLKFTDGGSTCLIEMPCEVATKRWMGIIGNCATRVVFNSISATTAPIIDAICNAKKLKKLSLYEDLYNFIWDPSQNFSNPFTQLVEACHASLQKIVVPAKFYFDRNPQIFHLRSLHFKSDEDDILPYLNHPSCTAEELIIELNEQEGDPSIRWQTLINCFMNAQQPAFSRVKKLMLKLHIEHYINDALTTLLQIISQRFPVLKNFILINSLRLNESCHSFQDFDSQSRYYSPMNEELQNINFNFGIEIEWNVKYKVTENFFSEFCNMCRRTYSTFDSEIVSKNAMVLSKNDEYLQNSISFEVKIVNEV